MSFEKTLYFAYGSNLLKERVHLDNDCHFTFEGIAKLDNWKLTFDRTSKNWGGGVADIVPTEGNHIWGVVWQTDSRGIKNLDRQENIRDGVYRPINVTVELQNGEKLSCRTYVQVNKSDTPKQPSRYYKDVIVRGAQQNNLPQEYIRKLKEIPENDFVGEVDVYNRLGLQFGQGRF